MVLDVNLDKYGATMQGLFDKYGATMLRCGDSSQRVLTSFFCCRAPQSPEQQESTDRGTREVLKEAQNDVRGAAKPMLSKRTRRRRKNLCNVPPQTKNAYLDTIGLSEVHLTCQRDIMSETCATSCALSNLPTTHEYQYA